MRSFKTRLLIIIITGLVTLSVSLPALANGLIGGG